MFIVLSYCGASPSVSSRRHGVVYVAKVLKPDEPVQMIAFRKPVNFSMPVLVQTPRDVIRDSDIQRGAVFIGEDVYPVGVIAHAAEIIRDVSLRST
jgi:hypothetical protein